MELLQLRYFCDAAEGENISRTAEKYRVPPSGVSQSIKRLEAELGVRLFNRTSNKIALSEQGKIFYEAASGALSSLEEASRRLSDSGGDPCGDIKLLIQTNRRIVTLAIEKYKKLYPSVSFIINHSRGEKEELYDFIISDITPGKNCEKIDLISEKILLAVNKTSHLAALRRVELSTLRDERFVSMSHSSRLFELADSICREAGFVPNTVISTDDPYYVRKYVDMGLGVALVPEYSWRGLFSDKIALIDIGNYTRTTKLFLPKGRFLTRSASLFFEILKETFARESNGY